jgi:hypothetical protein
MMYEAMATRQLRTQPNVSDRVDNMPSAKYAESPTIPKWKRPEHTTEKLDWADIKVIDLSTFEEPGGKQKLAEELRDAVSWGVAVLFVD